MHAAKRMRTCLEEDAPCRYPNSVRPAGPMTVHQLVTWPLQLASDLCQAPDLKRNLACNLSKGLLLASDYAGARLADDAVARLLAELEVPLSLPSAAHLCAAYTCDQAKAPIKVCLDGGNPAKHHFENLEDRLPHGIRRQVDCIMAEAEELVALGVDKKKANEKVYHQVAKYLLKVCKEICPDGALRGPCMRHFGATCAVSMKPEDHDLDPAAITMGIAGVTCLGFTPLGTNARLSHSSMKDLHVWASSMRALELDFIFVESAAHFDKSLLQWWFEDLYHVVFYDHPGPLLLGHPMNRPRMYAALCNRERFATFGDMGGYTDMFQREVILTGDSYFNANSDIVLRELQHLAKQKHMAAPAKLEGADWVQYYPVGHKERFRCHDELRKQSNAQLHAFPTFLVSVNTCSQKLIPLCQDFCWGETLLLIVLGELTPIFHHLPGPPHHAVLGIDLLPKAEMIELVP